MIKARDQTVIAIIKQSTLDCYSVFTTKVHKVYAQSSNVEYASIIQFAIEKSARMMMMTTQQQ